MYYNFTHSSSWCFLAYYDIKTHENQKIPKTIMLHSPSSLVFINILLKIDSGETVESKSNLNCQWDVSFLDLYVIYVVVTRDNSEAALFTVFDWFLA
jgi:hypothetical protein